MTDEKKASDKETEVKNEEKKEETKEEKTTEVPAKFKSMVEEIEKMSVLDLAEFVKILEDKFGVSAAAPMAMAVAPTAGEAGAEGEKEEKSEYDVELISFGDSKINVIKAVKSATGLGLKDAKDIVEAAPKTIKEKVAKEEAEEMKKTLEEAGATVELK